MPKISVIMPLYNKEKRLKSSIESVLNQTYKDFELIIINDGSTDSSKDIVYEYNKIDDRIIYFEQSNQGVSIARNVGINMSKSKYITFLDADDEIDSTYLSKMLNNIGDSNVCYCGHYFVSKGKTNKARMKFQKGDIFENYIYNKCTPNTNSWFINKEFLDKYNIRFNSNISYGEDMIFFSKILLHDKNVTFVEEYLTYYYLDIKDSLSKNHINNIEKDIYWIKQVKKYIDFNENSTERKRKLIRAFDTYRLPAAIIYRVNINYNYIDSEKFLGLIDKYKSYINNIEFTNGLRSCKLIYFKYKILFYKMSLEAKK